MQYLSAPYPRRAFNPRRAFTLLELIISIVLMTVLLAGIWALLGIYQGQFEKSQDRVERWQLIRSLQHQLADDLKACHVPANEMPNDVSEAISDIPTTGESIDSQSLATHALSTDPLPRDALRTGQLGTGQLETGSGGKELVGTDSLPRDRASSSAPSLLHKWMIPAIGLEGTHKGLLLDILSPADPRDRRHAGVPKPGDKVSRVVYAFVDPVSATREGRPAGLVRCEWKAHELQSLSTINGGKLDLYGLIHQIQSPPREVASPFLHPESSTVGGDARSTAASKVSLLGLETIDVQRLDKDVVQRIDIVPELSSLLLSYYDGQQWHSSWSFSQRGRLPVAVEMRFDMKRPAPTMEPADPDPHVAAQRLLRERDKPSVDLERPMDGRIRSSQMAAPVGYRWLIYLDGQDQGRESGLFEEGAFALRDAAP
jgi:prepilin-type N-terminal cleavage/methylation domain-containing protein